MSPDRDVSTVVPVIIPLPDIPEISSNSAMMSNPCGNFLHRRGLTGPRFASIIGGMNELKSYSLLAIAIACEVAGTSFLKASDGFTMPVQTIGTLVFYAAAFYLLAIVVRSMPIGVVYAIWSGAGIVLISAVGWLRFGQSLSIATMFGIAVIAAGVIIVNLSSAAPPH